MASQLRLSLYVTLTNYGPADVKFLKKRGPFVRAINIPRKLVDMSLGEWDAFNTVSKSGQEKILGTQPGWRLSVSHFTNEKKYMCYTKVDESGNCVK